MTIGAMPIRAIYSGAYFKNGEWIYTHTMCWDDLFKLAEEHGSRSVRQYLEHGCTDKFIRLGAEWISF